jgi:hypothetical protein
MGNIKAATKGDNAGIAIEWASNALPKYKDEFTERNLVGERRLLLLPTIPGGHSGYAKAVAYDVAKLGLDAAKDLVFAYGDGATVPSDYHLLERMRVRTLKGMITLLAGGLPAQLPARSLRKSLIGLPKPDVIFCGDVIFPLMAERLRTLHHDIQVAPTFALLVRKMRALELEILADKNVHAIFITEEEELAALKDSPGLSSDCWNPAKGLTCASVALNKPPYDTLVWFGGLSAHKSVGMRYFLGAVWPSVAALRPELKLYLYGSGSEEYNNPANRIFSNGYYYPGPDDPSLPRHGNALYINPDLTGGGLKLKVADWLVAGQPFLSTPFGVEGYGELPPYATVLGIEGWKDELVRFSR